MKKGQALLLSQDYQHAGGVGGRVTTLKAMPALTQLPGNSGNSTKTNVYKNSFFPRIVVDFDKLSAEDSSFVHLTLKSSNTD